jgi:hypothetical protein
MALGYYMARSAKRRLTQDKELDLYALYKDSSSSDTSFTAILHVMASLAATHPKFVIDSVMVWRKSKNDAGATGDSIAVLLRDPAKRQDLHVRYPALKGKELENILRERRSVRLSLYLFESMRIETRAETDSLKLHSLSCLFYNPIKALKSSPTRGLGS